MTKTEFIEELEEIIAFSIQTRGSGLSAEAHEYFEAFKAVEEKVKPAFTENGAKILQWMQDNQEQFNNIFKSKEIGEGLFISSRAASGSIRKLVTDGYVSKIGGNPSCYSLTSAGMECVVSTEGAEED